MPSSSSVILAPDPDPPIVTGQVAEVDDFDAISAVAPDWGGATHFQIGKGPARARLALVCTPGLQLVQVFRSPGVRIVGTGPPGTVVVGVLLDGEDQLVEGRRWERSHLGVMPSGAEFDMISSRSHSILVAAVASKLLDEHAVAHWGEPFPSNAAAPFVRMKDDASRDALIDTWGRWTALASSWPADHVGAEMAHRIEAEVVGAILEAAEPVVAPGRTRPRRDLARKAENFIRESLTEQVNLEQVCSAAGAPPRTLHASFNSEYGIAPMAYRRALRFNGARRDLAAGGRGTTVSAVAAKWDFMEFGYFAVDYRRMFGESPRDTLRRAMGAARGSNRVAPRNVKLCEDLRTRS